jgi:hypothetical protein
MFLEELMSNLQCDRRSIVSQGLTEFRSPTDAVRNALVIQQRNGTVTAVEYLKSAEVSAAVIRRVLSSATIRLEDLHMVKASQQVTGEVNVATGSLS